MNYQSRYEEWLNNDYFDADFRKELAEIKDNQKEIEDRFYKDLEFGTGGLRGVIGAGSNRINKYVVRKANQGFANYINERFADQSNKSIAIAYDSRFMSPEFALESALVMAANGIKAYVFKTLHSTPELSFAVRELGCVGGIVVTASHNPPEYNGYKIYDEHGGQLVPFYADQVVSKVSEISDFNQVKFISEKEALAQEMLAYITDDMDVKYQKMVASLRLQTGNIDTGIKVVYTPLHGTGGVPVEQAVRNLGVQEFHVVAEQMKPDHKFSTVAYPNPEEVAAFKLSEALGRKVNADILLATDPDCDRVGVMVKDSTGQYVALNGNQTGALLVNYVLSFTNKSIENPTIIKTIVTSDFGKVIAEGLGVGVEETLTGFKFIGEKIREYEAEKTRTFIMGYEESYGYLAGTHVRDKDAVIASMLIVEMAAYYKKNGLSLLEVLSDLYGRYGYYKEALKSITLKGKDGLEKMGRMMSELREKPFQSVADNHVLRVMDCKSAKIMNLKTGEVSGSGLPSANVLKYIFEDESWFAIRPSGTEPKIKIYCSAKGETESEADTRLKTIMTEVAERIESID